MAELKNRSSEQCVLRNGPIEGITESGPPPEVQLPKDAGVSVTTSTQHSRMWSYWALRRK